MILCDFPNNKCNLKCEYCYITQLPEWSRVQEKPKYSMEHIAKCLSVERLGGPCLINMTGTGETMLEPRIVDLCRLLLEQGHYIEFVTNFTVTKVVDQFMELPSELQKHLEFKISFHYNELRRLNWMDRFFENIDNSFPYQSMTLQQIGIPVFDVIQVSTEKGVFFVELSADRY